MLGAVLKQARSQSDRKIIIAKPLTIDIYIDAADTQDSQHV